MIPLSDESSFRFVALSFKNLIRYIHVDPACVEEVQKKRDLLINFALYCVPFDILSLNIGQLDLTLRPQRIGDGIVESTKFVSSIAASIRPEGPSTRQRYVAENTAVARYFRFCDEFSYVDIDEMPDIFEQTTHVVRFRNCEAKYSCASHFAHFIKKFFKLSILPANTRSSVKICSHNLSAIQLRCLVWAFQTIYRESPCVVDER